MKQPFQMSWRVRGVSSLRSIRRLLWLPIFLAGALCGAQQFQEGQDFVFQDCYAHLKNGQLTLGNSHVRRSWRIEHGQLFATSFFDLDSKVEWMSTASNLPSPTPPEAMIAGVMRMRGGDGVFGPTEARSLRVELQQGTGELNVKYEFQIFPEASGVRMWISRDAASTGEKDSAPNTLDAIEHLRSDKPHLRFTQVALRDRTDERNELVFENEWLLQPNEASLELQGNIFVVEDTLTGDGFVFLKEAPQPEMRPVKTRFDARMTGSQTALNKTQEKKRTFFDISFYGHGLEGSGEGYPSVMVAFHGGRAGRIAALQRYQRQIRQYVPGRDGQFLSNTWGDRSTDTKVSENFVRKEIDAGKELGVDIVQVDDGWERGKTIATAAEGGIWEGYRARSPGFWQVNSARFPAGLLDLTNYARERGMRLGLWFAPDSSQDFKEWKQDADDLVRWNHVDHIAAFKLDSVKIRSKTAETNYHALVDRVIRQSSGKILLDLDVTAETRQGYFGNIAAGSLFVENRYTDWHRYWPHQTLRNFWKLAQYVDPVRLRMEFLNPDRNTALYQDDPLAPARYTPGCLFATTMFGSPLGWFENSSLSPTFVADAAPLIAEWKKQRDALYEGTIVPVGEAPDGVTWTGFESTSVDGRSGYLLLFRELNGDDQWTAPRGLFASGDYRVQVLGGKGSVTPSRRGFDVSIPEPLGFVWVKVDAVR